LEVRLEAGTVLTLGNVNCRVQVIIREVLLLWLWLLLLVVLVTLWKFDVDVSCGVLLGWSKEMELAAVEREQRYSMEPIHALRPFWRGAKHQIFKYDRWIWTLKMSARLVPVHQ